MDRNTFLKCVCGLGACGCVSSLLGVADAVAAEPAEVPDQRLAFARYQVANLVRFMAAGPAVPASTEAIEQTGRECAKLGGMGARFKGNPEGYFETARKAWGTEFQWDKAKGVVTVAVADGPCGCPLVDAKRTPAFWCNCAVGYQKEMFSAVFDRPVQATLKESKLAGAKRCVFEVQVGSTVD
jgi:hypothetical protein